VSFPWEVLTVGTVLYLVALPLGWFAYRDYQRKDAAAALQPSSTATPEVESPSVNPHLHPGDGERPGRLN
jgi:CDP-diacylglycerol--serine O-phosphatidyltransferase